LHHFQLYHHHHNMVGTHYENYRSLVNNLTNMRDPRHETVIIIIINIKFNITFIINILVVIIKST
jgi:hypothetical protein